MHAMKAAGCERRWRRQTNSWPACFAIFGYLWNRTPRPQRSHQPSSQNSNLITFKHQQDTHRQRQMRFQPQWSSRLFSACILLYFLSFEPKFVTCSLLDVELVADGLVAPLDLTVAPNDDSGRRFIVDQNGLGLHPHFQ